MERSKKLLAAVLILGIIDAAYLTVIHFAPGALVCPSVGTTVNCESVLGSSLSAVFGIPVALLGLVWFIASLFFLLFGHNKIMRNIWVLFGAGGIMYSVAGQAILGRICVYCSLLDVFIALSIWMFLYPKR
jgi:uncharacterized membrane protein